MEINEKYKGNKTVAVVSQRDEYYFIQYSGVQDFQSRISDDSKRYGFEVLAIYEKINDSVLKILDEVVLRLKKKEQVNLEGILEN